MTKFDKKVSQRPRCFARSGEAPGAAGERIRNGRDKGTYMMGTMRKRLACLLAVVIWLSAVLPTAALAANDEKAKEPTRAISIVFDNSGSMYQSEIGQPLMRWCQATYAMEVFAAMLNKGDVLRIHPMHEIEVDGSRYTMDSPLVINGADDAEKIRRIITIRPGDTPIEAIEAAYNGLQGVKADERWLIVLTDGEVFYTGYTELSKARTREELTKVLTQYNSSVNVMYLGIDMSSLSQAPEINGSMRKMVKTALSADVPSVLSAMSNFIFQRDEIPNDAKYKTDHSLNFDLPMKKLIILLQGENMDNVKLTSSGGNAPKADRSYKLKYSEKGVENQYQQQAVDTSLQGILVTFSNVPAGNYTLQYDGTASAVSVYYEPSVDLAVVLCDANGRTVGDNEELYPGQYYIAYGLLDSDGNFTDSELLGKTQYTIDYELNGVAQPAIQASGTGVYPITLNADDTIKAIHAKVNYLITDSRPEGYIMERSGAELGWKEAGFKIVREPAGTLRLELGGGKDSYQLEKMEEEGVYQIRLVYDGQPLTGAQLQAAEIAAKVDPDHVIAELKPEQDHYTLRLKHKGAPSDTPMDTYHITVTSAYATEDSEVARTVAEFAFELSNPEHILEMELERPQSFYVISKVGDGAPLTARFKLDGQPLTDAQLAQISLKTESEGLPLEAEMVPGESAWRLRILPEDSLKSGIYTIRASADLSDEIGRTLSSQDKTSVELQPYPAWVRIAAVCLLALLILVLLLLYLNAKILPKSIQVRGATFNVDGVAIKGNVPCTFTGGKKKKGSLTIMLPKYSANPLVRAGFTVPLVAVSPRRTKSSARRAKVTGLTTNNTQAINNIRISAASFSKDTEGRHLVRAGVRPGAPVDFEIGSGIRFSISGEVADDGGGMSFSLSGTLSFK